MAMSTTPVLTDCRYSFWSPSVEFGKTWMSQRPPVDSFSVLPNCSSAMKDGCVSVWLSASYMVVGVVLPPLAPDVAPPPPPQAASPRVATAVAAMTASRVFFSMLVSLIELCRRRGPRVRLLRGRGEPASVPTTGLCRQGRRSSTEQFISNRGPRRCRILEIVTRTRWLLPHRLWRLRPRTGARHN